MLLLIIIYCIDVIFEGDDDLDSFSWNHVLTSSFQAPTSIHDRDIDSNLNQHNNTTFDSNQQHDMYNSSTADSYERLLKKTSRMIQSIISLYDTPPQATEQKSSSSSSSLSSSSSSSTTSTTPTTTDRDDYNPRRYIHLDGMIISGSIGGRHSSTHADDHVDNHGGHHHHDDCDGLVKSSPINNEDFHSYIDTTSTRDGILEMMSYELMQIISTVEHYMSSH
jgi:hypothetical protein